MVVPRFFGVSWRAALFAALILGVLITFSAVASEPAAASAGSKLYWIDDATYSASGVDRIIRSNLDGSDLEVVLSEDMDAEFAIPGLAVDAAGGHIYWTNAATGEIKRAGLDGQSIEVIAQTTENPLGIAFDSAAGKVYWSTSENILTASTIERANLDGSAREVILQPKAATYALALDGEAGHLYYASANQVFRANLDGSGAVLLFLAPQTPGTDKFSSLIIDLAIDSAGPDVYYTATGIGGEICYPVPGGEVCGNYDTSMEIGRRLSDGTIERFSGLAGPLVGGIAVAESEGAAFTTHLNGVARSALDFSGSTQIVGPAPAGAAVDMDVAAAGAPVGGVSSLPQLPDEDGSSGLTIALAAFALSMAILGAAWWTRTELAR